MMYIQVGISSYRDFRDEPYDYYYFIFFVWIWLCGVYHIFDRALHLMIVSQCFVWSRGKQEALQTSFSVSLLFFSFFFELRYVFQCAVHAYNKYMRRELWEFRTFCKFPYTQRISRCNIAFLLAPSVNTKSGKWDGAISVVKSYACQVAGLKLRIGEGGGGGAGKTITLGRDWIRLGLTLKWLVGHHGNCSAFTRAPMHISNFENGTKNVSQIPKRKHIIEWVKTGMYHLQTFSSVNSWGYQRAFSVGW